MRRYSRQHYPCSLVTLALGILTILEACGIFTFQASASQSIMVNKLGSSHDRCQWVYIQS